MQVANTTLSLVCYTCQKEININNNTGGDDGSGCTSCPICGEFMFCSSKCATTSNAHTDNCTPLDSFDDNRFDVTATMALLTRMISMYPCIDLLLAMDTMARETGCIIGIHSASADECELHYGGTTARTWHGADNSQRLILKLMSFDSLGDSRLESFSRTQRQHPSSKYIFMFLVCSSPWFSVGTLSVTQLALTEDSARVVPMADERAMAVVNHLTGSVAGAKECPQLQTVVFAMPELVPGDTSVISDDVLINTLGSVDCRDRFFDYLMPKPACFSCEKALTNPARCGRCHRAWYCGVDCQRAGWLGHKKLCVAEKK